RKHTRSALFPYTTLFRSEGDDAGGLGGDIADFFEVAVFLVGDQFGNAADAGGDGDDAAGHGFEGDEAERFHLAGHEQDVGERDEDRKSTRLNSSHRTISY